MISWPSDSLRLRGCARRRFRRRCTSAALVFLAALAMPTGATAGEGGLTLPEAIRRCLRHPRVLASRELVVQARAEARTASLLPNPSLSLEAGLLPLSRRYTVDEPGGPMELSAGVSYPIDWLLFGKRAAARAAAGEGIAVAQAEHAELVRQRVAETAEAFYNVLEAEALLEVASQASSELARVEEATGRAAASGGRPRVELSRVRLELQSARREERAARTAVGEARASLQARLGGSSLASTLRVTGTLEAPLAGGPEPVSRAQEIAASHRPDIQLLRRKLAQARHEVVVEARKALPETTLGLGIAHQFQRSIGAPDVTAWGASVELSLPVFDRNQGQRSKAASTVARSQHELQAALLELRAEVEQAAQALSTALENARDLARSELQLAGQVRDSFRKAYEVGGRSLVEMLDAERSYRETYAAYVSSRADYWRSLHRYNSSLGRMVIP